LILDRIRDFTVDEFELGLNDIFVVGEKSFHGLSIPLTSLIHDAIVNAGSLVIRSRINEIELDEYLQVVPPRPVLALRTMVSQHFSTDQEGEGEDDDGARM
jgi:hypothetical protein